MLCDKDEETLGDKITDPALKSCLDPPEDKNNKPNKGEDVVKNPPKEKPQEPNVEC